MILEYIIPLALLTDPNQKPALDPGQPFHLGFEWGGMTEEMRKQMAANVGADNVRANSRAADMTTGGEESGRAPRRGLGAQRLARRRHAPDAQEIRFLDRPQTRRKKSDPAAVPAA